MFFQRGQRQRVQRQRPGSAPSALDGEWNRTPGEHERSIIADGVMRWFLYHVPRSYNPQKATPLLLYFHGGGGNMRQARPDLTKLAEEKGFILVRPNGQTRYLQNRGEKATWAAVHGCGYALASGKSDVAFTRLLVEAFRKNFRIAEKRIHACGFSNGGMLCHRLAAELPDIFASVGVSESTVGGRVTPGAPLQIVQPTAKIPIFLIHGVADPVVLYNGGSHGKDEERWDVSFPDGVGLWVKSNGVDPTPKVQSFETGKGPVRVESYSGGADVVAVSAKNLQHNWPSKDKSGFDGPRMMVDFFEKHPKP